MQEEALTSFTDAFTDIIYLTHLACLRVRHSY